jgi:predicted DNA-binding ribbon-helix-helix protein
VSEEKHTTCVQLPEAVWQSLKDIADKKGTSIADVLRSIIDLYLFIVKAAPSNADIDMLERMVIMAFEIVKASCGGRK